MSLNKINKIILIEWEPQNYCFPLTKQKIMKTYIVKVNILKGDEKGTISSENLEYSFNKPLMIESRKLAIAKAKEIIHSFDNEMPEGEKFDYFLTAQLRGFKNFKSYSLDIIFLTEEDQYHIYGEEENMIEELTGEASYYYLNGECEDLIEVENDEEEFVEILESDNDFFLDN